MEVTIGAAAGELLMQATRETKSAAKMIVVGSLKNFMI